MRKSFVLVLVAFVFMTSCKKEDELDQKVPINVKKQIAETNAAKATVAPPAPTAGPQPVLSPQKVELANGLAYTTTVTGVGEGLKTGDSPSLRVVLRNPQGSVLWKGDFGFVLGSNQAIQGMDKGVVGMKRGEKRFLYVPSALAYGESGNPPTIPPGQDLVFEVDYVK